MAEPISSYNRELIEQARNVNKLLALYVLALQEEMALTKYDHDRLARTLRSVADTVEQEGRKPPVGVSRSSRPVIQVGDGPRASRAAVEV